MQNNDIAKIMNMERSDISPAVYSLFPHFQPTAGFVERRFSLAAKTVGQKQKLKVENVKQRMTLHFNSCIW